MTDERRLLWEVAVGGSLNVFDACHVLRNQRC